MVDTTLHTPGVLETSTNEDPFRTPRIRRTLLSVSPRTPTPFKNALKVLNETKLAHTPGNFEADFNEIIKKEEEESGLHLSSSTEKTPRRVRTSLEEKYARLSKTATEVSSVPVSIKEEQSDVNEQQNSIITVEDSGIVQTSLSTSPSQDSSHIKPSEIFGKHDPFATPSTVPTETVRHRRKGHPMRLLRFQETPQKSAPKLDSKWEQVACGKTPDQQLLTRQAHQFLASYRPAARTLHFSTTTTVA